MKPSLITIDELNSDKEELYADLAMVGSTINITLLDDLEGNERVSLSILEPIFQEIEESGKCVFTHTKDIYGIDMGLEYKVEGEYLYASVVSKGEEILTYSIKHQEGEGLSMDVLKNGDITEELGWLSYEDMSPKVDNPDEKIDFFKDFTEEEKDVVMYVLQSYQDQRTDIELKQKMEVAIANLREGHIEVKYLDYIATDMSIRLDDELSNMRENTEFLDAILENIKILNKAEVMCRSIVTGENKEKTNKEKILNALASGRTDEFDEAFFKMNAHFSESVYIDEDLLNKMTPEKAKELHDGLWLEEDFLKKREKELHSEILELTRQSMKRHIMICKYSTILALRNYRGNITHIVNPSTERGLVNLGDVDMHLSVPRYEPETAKEWMKEELNLYGGDPELSAKTTKETLSESQLRDLVLNEKKKQLDSCERSLVLAKSLKVRINGGKLNQKAQKPKSTLKP